MPKSRSTIPIVHADKLTFALSDEEWQAIQDAYGRQLNADARQEITTVTTQYLMDCVFESEAALKEMARKRIERVRQAAGDLQRVMLDREVFSGSSDAISRQQQQQQSAHSYADVLIGRNLDEHLRAREKLPHFRDALKCLVVACDCALNDLSAAEYCDYDPWALWIQGLTRIAQRHCLRHGARIVETSGAPSPFVALVRALQKHVPARRRSGEALAKAIQRAQGCARDK